MAEDAGWKKNISIIRDQKNCSTQIRLQMEYSRPIVAWWTMGTVDY